MLVRTAIKAATAALLALAAVQATNAQQLHGNGVDNQPAPSATGNAHLGSAAAASAPGGTPMPSPIWAPTGVSGRVAPAVSTPSSQPMLQQIRR